MAVRRESVVLSLQDDFTSGMARATAATALFKRELNGLDGKNVSRDLDNSSKSVDRLGNSTRKAGPEIDRFGGRLRLLTDAAVTLGPALIPITAGAIPALTGALAGLGAAAGGVGVTVLAMHGLGDAIKAIDAYKLDPTIENLQKLRIEQEKLGPAGAEFAHYLTNLEPTIRGLQNTARGGIFPGLEDGIDAILTRGPEVTEIIDRLSQGMGDIARNAGMALSSDEWTPFFNYVEENAKPTLEAFAQATGNVALGLANLVVAFAPVQHGFTDGLVAMTESFARWSQGLDQNQGFQDFVSYIQRSGPEVIDLLGALVKAMAGIVQAAAPWGTVVLQALTGVAKVFGEIADSPIGPGLYTAAAAMIAFNRATSIAEKSSARFTKTWSNMSRLQTVSGGIGGLALLASSLTDVDEKAGLANTTLGASAGLMVGGPWGLAIGTAIGQVLDFKDAYDQAAASVSAADEVLRDGNANALLKERIALQDQLSKEHPDDVTLSNYMTAVIGSFHDFSGQSADFKERIGEINVALRNGGDIADLFGETIGQTGDQLRTAASSAEEFSGALARLSGWFDKRDAVRAYKDSIDELRKSMKDGFTREDAANLDNIGKSILQVANSIKSPQVRGDFLASARAQLVDMAEHSGPRAAAAIQEIVDKFDDKGLTHPTITPTVDDSRAAHASERLKNKVKGDFDIMDSLRATPTVDADSKPAETKIGTVQQFMNILDRAVSKPKVNVDPGNSLNLLDAIKTQLGSLHDRTITVRVNQIGGVTSSAGGHSTGAPTADGGTVPKSGRPYADRYHYLLADGEEVVSNRYGQADRHRSLLKAINANRMADGGTAGDSTSKGPHHFTLFTNPELAALIDNAHSTAQALHLLTNALDKSEKALDKEKTARDNVLSNMTALSSAVSSKFDVNLGATSSTPWASGGGLQSTIATATSEANAFPAIIAALKAAGLTGPALQEALQEMDFNQLQTLAANPSQAGQLGTALTSLYAAQQTAGSAGGSAVYGDAAAVEGKRYLELRDEVRALRKDVRAADRNNQTGHRENAEHVGATFTGATRDGHRRGLRGPR